MVIFPTCFHIVSFLILPGTVCYTFSLNFDCFLHFCIHLLCPFSDNAIFFSLYYSYTTISPEHFHFFLHSFSLLLTCRASLQVLAFLFLTVAWSSKLCLIIFWYYSLSLTLTEDLIRLGLFPTVHLLSLSHLVYILLRTNYESTLIKLPPLFTVQCRYLLVVQLQQWVAVVKYAFHMLVCFWPLRLR